MAGIQATFTADDRAFHVEGYEKIEFDLLYVEGAFAVHNTEIADSYRAFGRTLMVIDETVHELYREQIQTYFAHHEIDLTVFTVNHDETGKTMRTLESIVDAIDAFGLVRTEPVLVVGGGLTTDVAGLACATYRRRTNYIRVPTTLIGLIDASVAIKVAVNHKKLKNRLHFLRGVEGAESSTSPSCARCLRTRSATAWPRSSRSPWSATPRSSTCSRPTARSC